MKDRNMDDSKVITLEKAIGEMTGLPRYQFTKVDEAFAALICRDETALEALKDFAEMVYSKGRLDKFEEMRAKGKG